MSLFVNSKLAQHSERTLNQHYPSSGPPKISLITLDFTPYKFSHWQTPCFSRFSAKYLVHCSVDTRKLTHGSQAGTMGPDASEMNSPLRNSPPFSNLLRVQAALFHEQQQFGCNLADKYFPHVHK